MVPATLETDRLRLRAWRPQDREPFADLNADPSVMEYYPTTLSRSESDAIVDRIEGHFATHGYGLWAVEVRDGGPFAGFVGIQHVRFDAPFVPAVEIGWRLAADLWGRGYATEGAKAVRDFAFDSLHLSEIVSFTTPANLASRRVMEKIGMVHEPEFDFEHPHLPANSPFRPHVFYRLRT